MRKIIIAICGVVLAGGAIGAVTSVDKNIQSAWLFSGDNPKTNITNQYSIKKNDTYKFDYVNIAAATHIYEHGAEFCRIQLQHNYENWKVFVAPGSCRTICKDGHYGTRCNSTTPTECEHSTLTKIFDSAAEPSPYKEESIEGFYSHQTDVILLQIISSTGHSVTVAPVEFYGANDKRTNIASINTRGQSQVLCAPGYDKQGDTCVLTSQCETNSSENSSSEQECPTTLKQGINAAGECIECTDPHEMFTDDGCKPYTKLSTLQLKQGIQGLFDCWQELGSDNYKKCVLCESPKSYNKTEKTCQ